MPSKFKIEPPSPEPVSGLSLIDQIETAVNEIGGQYEELETEVSLKVGEALQTSQNAEAVANSALQTAQDAETVANEARGTAGGALNTANQAQIAAGQAATKADLAYDQSSLALTDSRAALSHSQTALGQSETALEQSTEALEAAESAQTTSRAALEAASQAVGNFIIDDEACDANTFFESPEKKFVTNPASTHFPGGLDFPVYFEILTSSDALWVTQKCWGADASLVHARTGTVDRAEPENPVVAWEAWRTSASQNQAGFINFFAMPVPPLGWLECNGVEVSRQTFSNLFSVIGTTFGEGDGSTTFNLPDLRGEFIRGWDNGRGVDADRVFGAAQGFALENILGSAQIGGYSTSWPNNDGALYGITVGNYRPASGIASDTVRSANRLGFDASRSVSTANETRPRNIALMCCIKF